MAVAGRTHHITLSTLAGTPMGFMLMRDKRGNPLWSWRAFKTLPGRVMADLEYGYAQFPDAVAKMWVETTWQYGMGGITRDDSYKLAEGYKLDTSAVGKMQLARSMPISTADAVPTQYVPSGFVKSGTQMWAFVGDYTYTWDFTNKNWDRSTQYAGTTGPRMFRNGVEWAGYVVVPSWADDVGSGGSYVVADEPFTYLYKTTGAAAWTQKAFSLTHPAYCKFFAVANSKLIMGYVGDTAATSSALSTTLDSSQTTFDITNVSNYVAGDILGHVGNTDHELMLVVSIATNTLTVVRGYRGSTAQTHGSTAVATNKVTLNKHHIRTTTSTTPDIWSTSTSVGDSSSPIVGMIGLDWGTSSYLYIFKTDGVYKYDFTNVDKLSTIGGPTNGRASCVWNGKVYFSKGGGGLYELDPDTDDITDVSFSSVMSGQTQLHGEVVALTSEADSIYALVLDTTNLKYHLLQGFSVSGNANISWQHVGAIVYTTGTDANHAALYPDNVPNGSAARQRIQVGVESTGSNLYPYHFFRSADQDAVFNTSNDSYGISIKQTYGLVNVDKRWGKVAFTTANLTANIYLEAQYRIDGGSWSWFASTQGGTASQAASKIIANTTLYFPAGTNGLACELKILGLTNTGATSPELADWAVTAQLRTDAPNSFPLVLDVRAGLRLLTGAVEHKVATLLAQLDTWAAQSDEITMVDLEGTTRTVILLPETYGKQVVRHAAGHRREWAVQVVAVQLT